MSATAPPKMPETPKGVTTLDADVRFDVERLSYRAAACIGAQIAGKVKALVDGKTVVIAGIPLLRDLANLQASYVSLRSLEQEFAQLVAPVQDLLKNRDAGMAKFNLDATVGLAAGVIPGVVAAAAAASSPITALAGTALGLVGLFRQDVSYFGQQTTVDATAFELSLASALRDSGASEVFVPELISVSEPATGPDSLQARLEAVERAKRRAWTFVAPLARELAQREAALDKAVKAQHQEEVDSLSARIGRLRQDLEPVSAPFSRAEQRFAELLSQWSRVEESTGLSRFARMIRAEVVIRREPLYLHAAVCASGGFKRTTRSLWRTMFFGDGVTFVGGAVVRWAIFEPTGSITQGGVIDDRIFSER